MEINHYWRRLNYLPQISYVNRFGTSNQLSFLLKILNYACGWQTNDLHQMMKHLTRL